jgi:hypothetical protein
MASNCHQETEGKGTIKLVKEICNRFSYYLAFDMPIISICMVFGWLFSWYSLESLFVGLGLMTLITLLTAFVMALIFSVHVQKSEVSK